MIESTIQQLTSPDPELRRQAIIYAGKSGDTRFMKPLGAVYKTDPDPALRELALKAGRHLRGLQSKVETGEQTQIFATQNMPVVESATPEIEQPVSAVAGSPFASWQSGSVSARPWSEPVSVNQGAFIDPIEAIRALGDPFEEANGRPALNILAGTTIEQDQQIRRVPTDADKKLAKGRLEHAIGFAVSGQHDKALVELADAVRIDPELAGDHIALNLATTVTGISSPNDAMAAVVAKIGEDRRKRMTSEGKADVSGRLGFDSGIITLVVQIVLLCVVSFIFSNVLIYGLINIMNQMMGMSSFRSANSAQDLLDAKAMLQSVSAGALLRNGILYTASSLAGIGITYIVGALMGGSGEFIRFVNSLMRVNIVTDFLLSLCLGALLFGIVNTTSMDALSGLLVISLGLAGLTIIGSMIWYVYAVGKAHEVGIFQGILIILAGWSASNFLNFIFGMFS
jgi:hypothetical protein